MTTTEATAVLRSEIVRLRSGHGGHGGRSPAALQLADAIEVVLSSSSDTEVCGMHCDGCDCAERRKP